jgi:type II secretory pathway component PulC
MPVRTFDAKYEASIDRPLFFQTRRPAPAKPSQVSAPEQPEPPAKPLNATLVGVAISPEKRMVVIKLATGKNVTLAEGEALDGWQLTRVKPELAEFHNKTATAELTFPFRPTSAAQPVATAAPTTLLRRRQ